MKKLVSVLLCMAVLVCVSCKKEKNSSGISFEEDLELYHVEVINGQQSSSSEPGPEGEFTLKQDETTGKYVAKRNYPCTSYNYGGAVGHNPIGIIIPCHRVIGADGSLTGYAGGLDRKIRLLKAEGIIIPDHHTKR